jgi:hypothetical protein
MKGQNQPKPTIPKNAANLTKLDNLAGLGHYNKPAKMNKLIRLDNEV